MINRVIVTGLKEGKQGLQLTMAPAGVDSVSRNWKRKLDSSTLTESRLLKKLRKGPIDYLKTSKTSRSFAAHATARVNGMHKEVNALGNQSLSGVNSESKRHPGGKVDESNEDMGLPSDTMVAIQIMRSQFPVVQQNGAQPFVLRSQLYSSMSDRTMVDRQLEELKHEKRIRVFKLMTAKDDHAIMLMEDYLTQVAEAERRMASKTPPKMQSAFSWFKDHVLTASINAGITHAQLVKLLGAGGGHVDDKHISVLIHGGLLVRQLMDQTAYWFTMPDVGSLLKSLVQGRKEVVQLVSKRKYGEVLEAELLKRQLRYSKLGMWFHIRDLKGLGQLETVPTTVGPLLKLPPK